MRWRFIRPNRAVAACHADAVSFSRFCCGDARRERGEVSSSSRKAAPSFAAPRAHGNGRLRRASASRAKRLVAALSRAARARSPLVTGRSVRAGYGAVGRVPGSRRPRARRRRFSPGRRRPRAGGGPRRWWCDPSRRRPFLSFRALLGERLRAIAVGRDGRDAAVGRPRRGATSRPAASAPSLATLDHELDVARDVERRHGDSSDSSSDAESAESRRVRRRRRRARRGRAEQLERRRARPGRVRRRAPRRVDASADKRRRVGRRRRRRRRELRGGWPSVSKNNACSARLRGSVSTRVAVKTLRAARLGARPSRGALRAFKREVAVLSRLRHPCVVRLLGACLAPPDLCIVEELVEGGESARVPARPRRAARRRGRRETRASKDDDVPVGVPASRSRWTCVRTSRARWRTSPRAG